MQNHDAQKSQDIPITQPKDLVSQYGQCQKAAIGQQGGHHHNACLPNDSAGQAQGGLCDIIEGGNYGGNSGQKNEQPGLGRQATEVQGDQQTSQEKGP